MIESHHRDVGCNMSRAFQVLIKSVRNCQICASHFQNDPNPVFQVSQKATILVAGQAPGRKVHETGIPFNDPSGDRLRSWMGISREIFYDENKIALLPMGFCYPGHARAGDLPPRPECAQAWRQQVLDLMPNLKLFLVIGQYAMQWHLGERMQSNLTETVRAWRSYQPEIFPMPHPSPRNNLWLRKNPWFEQEVLPVLQSRISGFLN